jgi:hypothetical protein
MNRNNFIPCCSAYAPEWKPDRGESGKEKIVQIELKCPVCPCHFVAASKANLEQVVQDMIEGGTWYALADGDSFQEMIEVALAKRGTIRCPSCGTPVQIRESDVEELIPVEAALV